MTTQNVIDAFTTDDGNFDFDSFDKLVSSLVTARADIRKKNKEAIKETQKANKQEVAELGKAYYKSLKEGDEFDYITSKKEKVHAKKIAPKSGSSARAACEVVSGLVIEEGKTNKRYPMFHQIVVPETFKVEEEF